MAESKGGRVYACDPDPAKGERDGRQYRVFTVHGDRIAFVTRVELDADADEGMATVTVIARAEQGAVLVDYEKNEAARASFRTWVQVRPVDHDPRPTPDAALWLAADGTITADDPVPDVPFTPPETKEQACQCQT